MTTPTNPKMRRDIFFCGKSPNQITRQTHPNGAAFFAGLDRATIADMHGRNRIARTLIVGLTCGLAGLSLAGSKTDGGPGVAVEAGAYLPTSSKIQDALGKQITTFGFGPGTIANPKGGTLSPDFAFITARKNGNKLFILPVTMTYQKTLGDAATANVVPFVSVGAGLAYFDYSIRDQAGVRTAAKKIGLTGTASVGVVISKRLTLSAEYNVFSKQDGLDFNGLKLTATLTLFKL